MFSLHNYAVISHSLPRWTNPSPTKIIALANRLGQSVRSLIINGRFLDGAESAVNVVAGNLTHALARNLGDWSVSLAVPPALRAASQAFDLPVRVVGHRNGIAWEQLDLPRCRKDGVVASFFNTVPMLGRGYVTMLHDAQVFSAPDSYSTATRLWRQMLSRRALSRGNYVLTVSDYSKRMLLDLVGGTQSQIGVVPNGVGRPGEAQPDLSAVTDLGLVPKCYCVALSTLLPHKNIGLLLRVFAQPSLQSMPLVLVGKTDRAAFESAGYAVPPSAVFPGFVSDSAIAGLYANAFAVLVPSLEEGFGLPALEAMALGTPVLVADRGALPEVVGDAALILPADTPDAWAQALQTLMQNPAQHEQFAARGPIHSAKYSWDGSAQTVLTHLDRWFAP